MGKLLRRYTFNHRCECEYDISKMGDYPGRKHYKKDISHGKIIIDIIKESNCFVFRYTFNSGAFFTVGVDGVMSLYSNRKYSRSTEEKYSCLSLDAVDYFIKKNTESSKYDHGYYVSKVTVEEDTEEFSS